MIFDKLKSGVRFTLLFLGSAGLSFPPISALAGDGERRLASPEAAAAALVAAATEKDSNAFHSIFGPEGRDLVSADLVQADNSFSNFVRRLTQKVYQMHQADSTVELQIGKEAQGSVAVSRSVGAG